MEFEIVKWFGEDWKRETFKSLTQRKASLEEFTYNGFIQINEQPERLIPEGFKKCENSMGYKFGNNYINLSPCDSPNPENK